MISTARGSRMKACSRAVFEVAQADWSGSKAKNVESAGIKHIKFEP